MSDVGTGPVAHHRRRFVFVVSSAASVPFVQPLVEELHRRGHKALVLAGRDELGTSPAQAGRDYQLIDALDRKVALPRPTQLMSLRSAILRQGADVVIPATPKAMLLTSFALRGTSTSMLLWFWGLPSESATGANRILLKRADHLSLSACSAAWFNSRSLLDVVMSLHPKLARKMIYTSPGTTHGLAQRYFDVQPVEHKAGEPLCIGFVGRLAADKGIDGLVNSFAQEPEADVAERELLLVGPVDDRDPITHATLNTIASHPRIHWIGPVKDPLPSYRRMSLLAFPSRREGFPNAPLEAAAVGIPTVAFDATGTRDAVAAGSGILVPQEDWPAFWAAVSRLAEPGIRAQMGYEARQRALTTYRQQDVIAAHAGFLEDWTEHRARGTSSTRLR